jgi:shikimate dehydrogenase
MKHSQAEGETPLAEASIPRGALIFDLVYNPIETPLLIEARKAGARALGGLAMLVYQGAESFQLWLSRKPPVDIMFNRARESLE